MKKGIINPFSYRIQENSVSGRYNYLMSNIIENYQHSIYGVNPPDDYIEYVCLSGKTTEDNDGGSTNAEDAQTVETEMGRFIQVVLRPYDKNVDISQICQLPDPAEPGISNEEIETRIARHYPAFLATSIEPYDSISSPSFGQIVEAKFFKGRAKDFNQSELRFKIKPASTIEMAPEYIFLSSVASSIPMSNLFGQPTLLGQQGINPTYPPLERIYIGSNEIYANQAVQNGRLPSELIGRATRGGKSKPTMLKELVGAYDQMAVDFRAKFPNKNISAWGYRTYERQITIKQEKPNLAAKPGTSNHGWGMAIDMHFYVDGESNYRKLRYNQPEYQWLRSNSSKYGWFNPPWASQGGKKEEPWHWEWSKKSSLFKG